MEKNIMVLTYGDSNNPSTWSNVPYLFTKTLEEKGFNVIRIDMSTKRTPIYFAYTLLAKIIKPSTTYYYVRSKMNRKKVNKIIKNAVDKYDDQVDLYISLSYDFSPSEYTDKKVLLFSDWPIEYALKSRYNREPDWLEKNDVERHRIIIEKADYVVSLFKDVANYMNNRFENKTYYFGGLINSFYPIEGFECIDNRNKITFIGKKSYIESAKNLINVYKKINKKIINEKQLELHIIGMTKNDFIGIDDDKIFFHGYLDKGKDKEKELYYKIMKESIILVNTSEKWAGMSSITEALYYYRPIITSKYDEFIEIFGNNIKFGLFSENNEKEIKLNLEKILNMNKKEYKKMCLEAHKSVEQFTYDKYIDNILNLVFK